MLNIYAQDFDPEGSIEPGLFTETWRILNQAAESGFAKSIFNPADEFRNQVKYNNAVFSAFKVHRQQNDITAQLLDAEGNLKSFSQFSRDVSGITSHYNRQWLNTEYDTAVTRAHRAAEWKQFEAESDVLPNIEWLQTLSPDPGEDHRPFWELPVRLPVGHSFWSRHRPGDRWGCKCGQMATDKPAQGGEVMSKMKIQPPDKGLDNNPADDGKLFSSSHPYYTNAHKGAEKAVESFLNQTLNMDE